MDKMYSDQLLLKTCILFLIIINLCILLTLFFIPKILIELYFSAIYILDIKKRTLNSSNFSGSCE